MLRPNLIASGLRVGLYLDRDGRAGLYYVVTAQNAWGESGPSNTAQAQVFHPWPPRPPVPPWPPVLPDLSLLLPGPLALLVLGRRKRWARRATPLAGVLLAVAVVSVGASLVAGGPAAAEVVGHAGAGEPQQGPGGETLTRTITYTYDPLHRLTGASYSTGESYEYAYDAVGNRTAYTHPGRVKSNDVLPNARDSTKR